jgi:hypothetical protein
VLAVGFAGAARSATNAATRPDREDAAVQHFAGDAHVIVGTALRYPTAETSSDARLFNVAGVALDLTWGQWTGASAIAKAAP